MGHYDAQLVCINGHQITDSYHGSPELRKDFCNVCGAMTIHTCPNCNSEIKGNYQVEGVISFFPTSVPEYCHSCGEPYPWTLNNPEENEEAEVGSLNIDDPFKVLEHLFQKFHGVVKQLRHRHNHRETLEINDEYDVQDLLHALLRLFFDDIRPEEWTPSYAGKSSRMDFLLKDESIVIEVKKTRKGLESKEIGDELIIDIERYKVHPFCKNLFCFVYDPEERIVNPRGVERDLDRGEDGLFVKVFIIP
jgi:hypothetical protein